MMKWVLDACNNNDNDNNNNDKFFHFVSIAVE